MADPKTPSSAPAVDTTLVKAAAAALPLPPKPKGPSKEDVATAVKLLEEAAKSGINLRGVVDELEKAQEDATIEGDFGPSFLDEKQTPPTFVVRAGTKMWTCPRDFPLEAGDLSVNSATKIKDAAGKDAWQTVIKRYSPGKSYRLTYDEIMELERRMSHAKQGWERGSFRVEPPARQVVLNIAQLEGGNKARRALGSATEIY
jgi:hypothetical protein